MNIVYACDDKYAMLVGVSVVSLFESNRECDTIEVYVLTTKVSNENKDKLKGIAEHYGRNVYFVELRNNLLDSGDLKIDAQRWSLAAFARLFTPQLLPNVQKILYLDCDTIIRGSLSELWETNLGEYSCAAVAEPFSKLNKKNVGMEATDVYYNSGVMLIDLDKWRMQNAISIFIESIKRHDGRVPYVDQGVINEVFCNMIYKLPAKYNVYTEYYDFSYKEVNRYRGDINVYSLEEIEAAKANPTIVHFVSSFLTPRPWVENSTHVYAKEWERNCAKTVWAFAEKWKDNPGKSKLMLRWVFNHTPRAVGIWLAWLLNSFIRPLLDK